MVFTLGHQGTAGSLTHSPKRWCSWWSLLKKRSTLGCPATAITHVPRVHAAMQGNEATTFQLLSRRISPPLLCLLCLLWDFFWLYLQKRWRSFFHVEHLLTCRMPLRTCGSQSVYVSNAELARFSCSSWPILMLNSQLSQGVELTNLRENIFFLGGISGRVPPS